MRVQVPSPLHRSHYLVMAYRYLPPVIGAIEAGVATLMCSYNARPVPMCVYTHVCKRVYRHALATRHAPLDSSRRGGHFEYRHAYTRAIDHAVGDGRSVSQKRGRRRVPGRARHVVECPAGRSV